jgi:hypothetical protein
MWMLSVRSIVRRRYALAPAHGAAWTFHTPFFWWMRVTGTESGTPRLLGCIGPTPTIWILRFEPGRDTLDVLAAVAFLHRQWWHM